MTRYISVAILAIAGLAGVGNLSAGHALAAGGPQEDKVSPLTFDPAGPLTLKVGEWRLVQVAVGQPAANALIHPAYTQPNLQANLDISDRSPAITDAFARDRFFTPGSDTKDFVVNCRREGASTLLIEVRYNTKAPGAANGETWYITKAYHVNCVKDTVAVAKPRTIRLDDGTVVRVNPGGLNFDGPGACACAVGTTAGPKQITFTNIGQKAVTIGNFATLAGAFGVQKGTGACKTTVRLAPGRSCAAWVTFTPPAPGQYDEGLAFTIDGHVATLPLAGTGKAAEPKKAAVLTIDHSTLDFGNVVAGEEKTLTITITNTGNDVLENLKFDLAPDLFDFDFDPGTCPSILTEGASCTLHVTFTAVAEHAGANSAVLTVSGVAGNAPQTVKLTANVVPRLAALSIQPQQLAFGSVQLGSTATDQTVTATNTGNVPVSFTSVSITGPTPSAFSIASNTCSGRLAVGASCGISVRFAPTTVGGFSESLLIIDEPGQQTVPLTGTATALPAPLIKFTPTSMDFGQVQVGSQPVFQMLTVTNSGTLPLHLTSLTISPAGAFGFSSGSGPSSCAVIQPAQSCQVDVGFQPPSAGSFSATLKAVSDAANTGDAAVTLSGQGSAGQAKLAFSANQLNFGSVNVGSSKVLPLKVTNVGDVPVTISSVALQGSYGSWFNVASSDCSGALPPGQSCTIQIAFTPPQATTAYISAQLVLRDNASDSPQVITLTGDAN